jgi:hypothetical protein
MANMIPISTVTVGSGGASTIEFNNITQNYTDLVLLTSLRSTDTSSNWGAATLRFNGDSGNNYYHKELYGTGSAAGSGEGSAATSMGAVRPNSNGTTANTFSNASFYIPNYTSSNQKSTSEDSVTENNATAALSPMVAGRWTGTSAITSIVLTPSGGFSWMQYSSATLYGIRKY